MSGPAAAVLLTGSELLDGRTRDRNGHYLGGTLSARGLPVSHILLAPDDGALLAADLDFLLATGPAVLVVSGGLGTTHDDLTAATVAAVTGHELETHPEAARMVAATTRRVARRRGLDPESLLPDMMRQALLPRGARPVPAAGVAPGFVLDHEGTAIVALPGVPWEVEAMWPGVLAELAGELGLEPGHTLSVRTYGRGEVQVAALLREQPTDRLAVAITASSGEVTVTARHGAGDEGAAAQAAALAAALSAAAPVFSTDGRTVDQIVADALRSRGETVAVAESCTGGLLGGRLTELAGSSDYVLGGVISYADEVKREQLGVPAELLASFGAVSEPVARAMAEGVRERLGATYGVSVTGIAGP
ncbi:MAG TPA: nicotinamide-nucleotide amidohydrolase family protein, partial [Thermoleophilia bacterium]|nr:nicotinamide-nucleotide amidohydrolase family protein [Thermoleophilia bacterium]